MKCIKILHVGDIHFPDRDRLVDLKDDAFPKPLADMISPDVLQEGVRTILDLKESDPAVAGILLAGDLTTRGDLAEYRECVRYLVKALRLSDPEVWPPGSIHLVPGNHDINRDEASAANGLGFKFQSLVDICREAGVELTVQGIRSTTVEIAKCRLILLSLNSCWGCQEKRHLPQAVREKLYDIIVQASGSDDEAATSAIWEQLDTPAFMQEDIDELTRLLAGLDERVLPVILAHHNLLPQATPRIEIYTELVNGGLVRSRLVQSKTPILFCHAHIHHDALEIVRSPFQGPGPLVVISAPPLQPRHDQLQSGAIYLQAGFNVIEIPFTDDGLPLGCRVVPYRFHPDGALRAVDRDVASIPLHPPAAYLRSANDDLLDLIRQLDDQEFERFPKVLNRFKSILGRPAEEEYLGELLREAEWFDLVRIVDGEEPYRFWQVKRRLP